MCGGGGGGGEGSAGKIFGHVATFRDSILFDMHSDNVIKKLAFDLLTPSQGSGVCVINICYHVVAFVIPFNLICNMKLF